jgi:hypothetical protein
MAKTAAPVVIDEAEAETLAFLEFIATGIRLFRSLFEFVPAAFI